jgi:hypothetical protein
MIIKTSTELGYLDLLQKSNEVGLLLPLIGLIFVTDLTSSVNNIDILGHNNFPMAIDEI